MTIPTFMEAREAASAWALSEAAGAGDELSIVLLWDPSAHLRVLVRRSSGRQSPDELVALANGAAAAAGSFWSGTVLDAGVGVAERQIFETAWATAVQHDDTARVRILERRRSKEDWFRAISPPWELTDTGPAIVSFVSFKGGFGRSTALAATAVALGARAKRVVAMDLDLEAPGLADLLPPSLGTPTEGIVDLLLQGERPTPESVAAASYPSAADDRVQVLPAGVLDDEYLEKLARLDHERLAEGDRTDGSISSLLQALRKPPNHMPDYVLLDARAGLHDLTAVAANGVAHLAVLFARHTPESWAGLRLVVRQLGRERIAAGASQQPVLLVLAKAPGSPGDAGTRTDALSAFRERAHDVFSDHYYADEETDEAMGPTALDDEDAAHQPIALGFDPEILFAQGIEAILSRLSSSDFVGLTDAVMLRLGREP